MCDDTLIHIYDKVVNFIFHITLKPIWIFLFITVLYIYISSQPIYDGEG